MNKDEAPMGEMEWSVETETAAYLTFTTATWTARGHKSQSDINDEELQPQHQTYHSPSHRVLEALHLSQALRVRFRGRACSVSGVSLRCINDATRGSGRSRS